VVAQRTIMGFFSVPTLITGFIVSSFNVYSLNIPIMHYCQGFVKSFL
jgi:hypothetical protein